MTISKVESLTMTMPTGRIAGILFVTVLSGAIFLFMFIAALFLLGSGEPRLALISGLCAGVLLVLFAYVLRDARGVWGWRVIMEGDTLDLRLPSGRSLSHHTSRYQGRIPVSQIEAIETRLESYSTLGQSNMQRSYAMRLQTGTVVFLGEDRAMGTALESSTLRDCVSKIIERHELPLRDLGMAEGKAGILQVLFSSPPEWDAPSLDAQTQVELTRRAWGTGRLAITLVILVLILISLF